MKNENIRSSKTTFSGNEFSTPGQNKNLTNDISQDIMFDKGILASRTFFRMRVPLKLGMET